MQPAILTPVHQRSRSAPARQSQPSDDPSFVQNADEADEVEGVTVLSADDEVIHEVILLPTPEEQLAQLTKEFPPAIIAIDTSEKSFNRMAAMRKSLIHVSEHITVNSMATFWDSLNLLGKNVCTKQRNTMLYFATLSISSHCYHVCVVVLSKWRQMKLYYETSMCAFLSIMKLSLWKYIMREKKWNI